MTRSKTCRQNRWNGSETDLSSTSDLDNEHSLFHHRQFSSDQSNENHPSKCCLICSILPSLSHINSCAEHLTLLNQASSSKPQRKKRSLILKSFNTIDTDEDSQRSIRTRSITSFIEKKKSANNQSNFSSSSISSSMNYDPNNNYLRKRKRRTISTVSSINDHQSDSSTPRIRLKRVIHVKDEDECIRLPSTPMTLNMIQATEQMSAQDDLRPRILLKRVCFER